MKEGKEEGRRERGGREEEGRREDGEMERKKRNERGNYVNISLRTL